ELFFFAGALSVARFSEKFPTIYFASCESIIGKVPRWSRGREIGSRKGRNNGDLAPPLFVRSTSDERENKKTDWQIAPLVSPSHAAKQRARSRAQSLSIVEPEKNRTVTKAFSGTQQTSQGETISVRHVDVELLH